MRLNLEIINTGSELLAGRVLNTHQQWLSRQFVGLGWQVRRQATIPDIGRDIQHALRDALSRADLIVTTGGLGPTSDDLTRQHIADVLHKSLREHPAVLAHIKEFFAQRGRPFHAGTSVQALVPEDALVLPNENGTAPGLFIAVRPNPIRPDGRASHILMLPGPPRELRPMFIKKALPLLRQTFPVETVANRILRCTGIGETQVEGELAEFLKPLLERELEVGYCSRAGEVDICLTARGPEAESLIMETERVVLARIGSYIFGSGEEDLAAVIVRLLRERRQTLALAESCTGGWLAHRITNVPGASEVFLGGCVVYSNFAKQQFLGVRAHTLETQGAVSAPTVREMAAGARQAHNVDFALAITGIAGPAGGRPDKPVGTVFLGLATRQSTWAIMKMNPYERETFKQISSQQALDWLRRHLLNLPEGQEPSLGVRPA